MLRNKKESVEELSASSSDEEEQEQNGILQRLLQHYVQNSTSNAPEIELQKVKSKLAEGIASQKHSDAQICLVCLEPVAKKDAVWSCKTCGELYHLVCTQKWANQALTLAEYREQDNVVWCCPKCRHEYTPREQPTKYLCFCGKVANPTTDPWLAPHSCGQKCGKSLGACQHNCVLLCHPGLCPDCPKVVSISCFCSVSRPVPRRCGTAGWSCAQLCNRLLSCGLHQCQQICHSDVCGVCDQKSVRSCRCGRKKEETECAERDWSCEQLCGKLVEPCGKHKCELVCHSGPCPPCVAPGSDCCPCGKHVYQESGCVDELPCCGDTCAKTLDCGVHECIERCHRGACPPCSQMRVKRCRCGLKERGTPCNKELLCETKCRRKRQCGRHPCNRKCCDGFTCPPCEQTCARPLNCGRHKCVAPCHNGMCYPCTEMVDVRCPCGGTRIRVPCGRDRKTKPPRCRLNCRQLPDCHHSARETHRCHPPPCPPCRQICNLDHPSGCGHKCNRRCHNAVLIDTNAPKSRPATAWEMPTPKMELVALQCPPCRQDVIIRCRGGHEDGTFKCCESRPYSCGRPCGQVLACGNHTCKKECHEVEADHVACEECYSMCTLERQKGCPHVCPRPCHPPPCPPCRQMIRENCHCGLNPKFIPCPEWNSASDKEKDQLLICGNLCPKLMTCGHRCLKICHTGLCSDSKECKKRITVVCPCGRKSIKVQCAKQQRPECDELCLEARKQREKEQLDTPVERASTEMEETPRYGRRNRKKKDRSGEERAGVGWGRRWVAVGTVVVVVAFLLWMAINNRLIDW